MLKTYFYLVGTYIKIWPEPNKIKMLSYTNYIIYKKGWGNYSNYIIF